MLRLAAAIVASIIAVSAARAGEPSKCAVARLALWGDGVHDDTAALNAWFRGEGVIWAPTGSPIGSRIVGRVFRLKGVVSIPSGTGRSIERFALVWPERQERVSGGSISAGNDRNKPPIATDLVKIGAGPNEGVPYPAPDPKPADPDTGSGCLVS